MSGGSRFIEGKLYEVPELDPQPLRSQLTSEVSMRLHELHEHDPGAALSFLQLMVKLYRIDPWVYQMSLAILAGNMHAGLSLAKEAVTGKHSHHSKQHEHQRQNRALAKLDAYLPQIAEIIREILFRERGENSTLEHTI